MDVNIIVADVECHESILFIHGITPNEIAVEFESTSRALQARTSPLGHAILHIISYSQHNFKLS